MVTESQVKEKMEMALEHFKEALKGLRSNRANSAMVENVIVDVYGSHMKIRELANITTPESRQILIIPFDPKTAGFIAKAIEKANLNLQPILESGAVRINVPPMDMSTRQEIVKMGRQKVEESKIALREVRRKNKDFLKKQKIDGEITEEQLKRLEKALQDLTDKYTKAVDDLFAKKEKEILAI
jgi:ribosome recycling factor